MRLSVRLLRVSGSPRAFSPRDDKSGIITIERVKRLRLHPLSLRGGSEATDAAIHRASEDADGAVCPVTQGPWIVTGLHPRDDKVEEKKIVFTGSLVPVLDYCPRLYSACTSSADKARS